MSAGVSAESLISRDTTLLAPKFWEAVQAALAECATNNLDAFIYEAYRTEQLQSMYYARGRTVIPPTTTVTNASSNLYSWHGFGLAVDVISRSKEWDAGDAWFAQMGAIFKNHNCKWGGDWKMKDVPHVQWGPCKPSPSDNARAILASSGVQGVWEAVGAA
jgi:peptidoglycan LD-endopeptidase CwlK